VLALLVTLWTSWKRATHALGSGIQWLMMASVYVLVFPPVVLGLRLTRPDPTDRGPGAPGAPSEWKPPRDPRQDVRRAQRPW